MNPKTPARLRIEAGFHSIKKLASKARLCPGTISRYESGKLFFLCETSLINMAIIANHCKVHFKEYRDAVLNQRQRVLKK